MLEEATGLRDKSAIAPLGYTILFWRRRKSVCVLSAFGGEEGRQGFVQELATPIGMKTSDWSTKPHFRL
jgi:hypothetical protein